jgi:hypothetical protein
MIFARRRWSVSVSGRYAREKLVVAVLLRDLRIGGGFRPRTCAGEAGKLCSLSPPDTFADYLSMRRLRVADAYAIPVSKVWREHVESARSFDVLLAIPVG